uniref:RRM domain-containing protein n=1 Tax=Leersia perrieri TaxID=77586 RepID=A0A0D9WES3_9ORYZ
MACPKSPEQNICYICGDDEHMEHSCPYNYIFGRYFIDTCRGECPLGEHRITSGDHRKFLRRFVRVSNLPLGFRLWDLEDLFIPFGPLLMWDVPKLHSAVCGCPTEIRMSFGVVVFKRRKDGERAINELNGHVTGGRKLRVDWAYPSFV